MYCSSVLVLAIYEGNPLSRVGKGLGAMRANWGHLDIDSFLRRFGTHTPTALIVARLLWEVCKVFSTESVSLTGTLVNLLWISRV
jgi:hypothetical protein